MHGAVDLIVVGWFGDATSLSTVSTGSNLVQMATMLIAGLTMGATVLIGDAISVKTTPNGQVKPLVRQFVCLQLLR